MTTKSNDHKSSDDALSAILGDTPLPGVHGAEDQEVHAQDDVRDDTDTDDLDVEYVESDDDTGGYPEHEGDQYDETDERSVYSEIRSRRAARRHELKQRKAQTTGRRSRFLGGLLLVAGIALQVVVNRGALQIDLSQYGVEPTLLFGLGAIIMIVGLVRRQLALSNSRIDELAYTHQEAQLDVQAHLQYLVEHQQHHFERPPAQGEELERVLIALQRQDDKVNNLSRALKMYGKPLMEIANQSADVAAAVAALKTQLDASAASTKDGFARLAAATDEIDATVDLKPLQELTGKLADDIRRNIRELGEKLPNMSGLQQQLVRLEASVQSLNQRQDDSEVRKSLVRLEDSNKVQGKKLDELAKADAVTMETQKLEKQLDQAITKLGTTVDQMRQQELGTLDSGLRELQRELASIATTTAYIQQAVKSGGGMAAPAPSRPQGSAPKGNGPTPTSSPASGGSSAAKPAADGDAAGYSTGKRATSGKNVLGAIAKLKNMKK